ncbi:MAG TPA: glycosyltransferase family 1 protein, partial [Agromyces sp.]
MKIVVDCRYTRIGHHDGISRFTAGIVGELAKLHPVTMLVSDHRQLEMLPPLPWQLVSSPTSAREPFVARQVRRLRPDVVFSPMQTMGSWGRDYRLLLTLHDL